MTRIAKSVGRLLLAESEHRQPFFTQPHRKSGEIAVAGDQAKSVEFTRVQQIHRINNQRAVGCILTGGIGKLLNRFDGVFLQYLFPRRTGRNREIAVDALYRRLTVTRDFREQILNDRRLRVIRIDQYGQTERPFLGFSFCNGSCGYH